MACESRVECAEPQLKDCSQSWGPWLLHRQRTQGGPECYWCSQEKIEKAGGVPKGPAHGPALSFPSWRAERVAIIVMGEET